MVAARKRWQGWSAVFLGGYLYWLIWQCLHPYVPIWFSNKNKNLVRIFSFFLLLIQKSYGTQVKVMTASIKLGKKKSEEIIFGKCHFIHLYLTNGFSHVWTYSITNSNIISNKKDNIGTSPINHICRGMIFTWLVFILTKLKINTTCKIYMTTRVINRERFKTFFVIFWILWRQ